MSDMIAAGAKWMAGKMTGYVAHPITYQRGDVSLSINAGVGSTPFRVDEGGVWVRIQSRDFLVAKTDMGELDLPAEGDLITETIDGVAVEFEVMAPGGEPAWRWSGPTRDRLRIHTKRTSDQA